MLSTGTLSETFATAHIFHSDMWNQRQGLTGTSLSQVHLTKCRHVHGDRGLSLELLPFC